MLNHITIMGRLTRDPELRYTKSNTPVASFTVAVDRDYADADGSRETDFIDCVAWKQGAEFVSNYFRKGSMIVVSGSLQSRKWQDRDGNKRTSWEIRVDHTYFGEARRDGESRHDSAPPARSYGDPNVYGGMQDMGPGTGAGNPFTQTQQQSLDEDDGELPF